MTALPALVALSLLAAPPTSAPAAAPAPAPAAKSAAPAAKPVDEAAARKAAEAAGRAWLKIVDAGNYAESWRAASSTFRDNLSLADWVGAMQSVAETTGPLLGREFVSATFTENVPGTVGTFVILLFRSSFTKAPEAREIVTMQREGNGEWRLAGYFVRPPPGAAP